MRSLVFGLCDSRLGLLLCCFVDSAVGCFCGLVALNFDGLVASGDFGCVVAVVD